MQAVRPPSSTNMLRRAIWLASGIHCTHLCLEETAQKKKQVLKSKDSISSPKTNVSHPEVSLKFILNLET